MQDTEAVSLLDGAVGYASIFIDNYKGSPRSKLATEGFLTPEELSQRGITATVAPPAPAPIVAPPAPVQAPAIEGAVVQPMTEAKEPF